MYMCAAPAASRADASAAGFISAMLSNLTFGFRAVWGKA
jgi:hypothetical protein